MAKPDHAQQATRAASDPHGHTTPGVIMKSFGQTRKLIALAIGVLTMSACASLDAGHASVVPGAKIDSGLGELPHYRNWVDPTGRAPMGSMRTASVVPAGKIDSGLGELPHYRDWVDASGRMPTRSMLTASGTTR
jgi:hypothetical protein